MAAVGMPRFTLYLTVSSTSIVSVLATPPIRLRFFSTMLPRLNASQQIPVALGMPYAPYEGMNNISLVVDANSKIKEKNELNNQIDFPITVKYNETFKALAKTYGEDYYKKFPTQEECEKQNKC